MWIFGIGALLCLTAGVTAVLNRGRGSPPITSHWDLIGLGNAYAQILTSLATIAFAAAVFLAEIRGDAGAAAYSNVIGLFLIAFIVLLGTSVTYATACTAVAPEQSDLNFIVARRVMFALSTLCFYLGVSLALLGLRPLLISIHLDDIAGIFSWLLLFVLFAGANRVSAWMHGLLGATVSAVALGPLVAIGMASFYRLVLVPVFPWLWPTDNPTIALGVSVLVLASVVFFLESMMIRFHGADRAQAFLCRFGPGWLPPCAMVGVAAISCVWLSLIVPLE